MKNKRYLGIIALLLVVAMALSACAQDPVVDGVEDDPVTAEGVFQNFIKLETPEDNPLGKVTLISETYGELVDADGDIAIFRKESKDKLNNLTETYSLYSISEGKSLLNITNSYPDEYGWENDFGHTSYPERLINDVWLDTRAGVSYVVVEWETRAPIDEEIIKDEDLAESYVVDDYCDFYDITGKLIATTGISNRGNVIDKDDYRTLISFGKTVAIFDNDGKLVSTYNGDVEADPINYFHTNDKYNYLAVPNGIVDESQQMSRMKIEVYDKEGNLVRTYENGDYASIVLPMVLENGDVLIQHMVYSESDDCDFSMDGVNMNVDTFLLDVESGKVTELTDFGYVLMMAEIVYSDNFAEELDIDGIATTDNVRNVIVGAISIETEEDSLLFVDNLGNVNYVLETAINKEMGEWDEVIRVLDSEHMLVTISSTVTERAIIGKDGSLIAHLPDDAVVLADYVISGEALYDFDMKKISDLSYHWMSSYDSISDPIVFGNCLAFEALKEYTPGDGSDPYEVNYVIIYNAVWNSHSEYDEAYIASHSDTEGMGGYVAIGYDDPANRSYTYIAGNCRTILVTPNGSNVSTVVMDDALLVEVDDRVYLITEVAENTEGGDDK